MVVRGCSQPHESACPRASSPCLPEGIGSKDGATIGILRTRENGKTCTGRKRAVHGEEMDGPRGAAGSPWLPIAPRGATGSGWGAMGTCPSRARRRTHTVTGGELLFPVFGGVHICLATCLFLPVGARRDARGGLPDPVGAGRPGSARADGVRALGPLRAGASGSPDADAGGAAAGTAPALSGASAPLDRQGLDAHVLGHHRGDRSLPRGEAGLPPTSRSGPWTSSP